VLIEQAPGDARVAVPIRAFVEIAEPAAARRLAVAAGGPLAVDFAVAVGAVVRSVVVGRRIDPAVGGIILRGERVEAEIERVGAGGEAADQEAVGPRGEAAGIGRTRQAKSAGGVGRGCVVRGLEADAGACEGLIPGQNPAREFGGRIGDRRDAIAAHGGDQQQEQEATHGYDRWVGGFPAIFPFSNGRR
jgi:hypothetical protein